MLALFAVYGVAEAGDTIKFKDTQKDWIEISSFDWLVGNSLLDQALPTSPDPLNPTLYNVYLQASLANFIGPDGRALVGTGLGIDYEITVVFAHKEGAILFGLNSNYFLIPPAAKLGGINYFKVYYDNTIDSNPLAGTGYNDGTLLMEGEMQRGYGNFFNANLGYQDFDQFGMNNEYPGLGALIGIGSRDNLTAADTTTINSSYIDTGIPLTELKAFALLTNAVDQPAFIQQEPSKKFWGGTDYLPEPSFTPVSGDPNFTAANGVQPTEGTYDFQLQSDANTNFTVTPYEQTGACRMTGGNNTVAPDGEVEYVVGTYGEVIKRVQVRKNSTTEFKYTTGGQIGASQAGCLPGPDNQFGEWEHSHHQNGELKFSFHAGSHSAPDDAYIHCIACSDPKWCTQARCAPFKQIFWEGTGVFKNAKNNDSPIKLDGCTIDPWANPSDDGYSLHYYYAHVGDFGEPGNTCPNPVDPNDPCLKQQPTWNPATCHWQSGGVDIDDTELMLPQPPVPDPKFPQFFRKGGVLCENCPDWYEIEIYCSETPPGPGVAPIYRASGWLTGGNYQIHPEVGQHCPAEKK
jgi:hypothetical protein